MSTGKILIAGVGNIFFGDDAFGVEVARQLAARSLPEGVQAVDFGIRSLDLTYALLDDYEVVILVDAVPRGDQPGTLYVLEPSVDETNRPLGQGLTLEMHALDLPNVLRMAWSLGSRVKRVLLVGCEPQLPEPDDLQMAMSEPVQAAVGEAIRLVENLVREIRAGDLARSGSQATSPNMGSR
jgi:hydrogenase maturation protease